MKKKTLIVLVLIAGILTGSPSAYAASAADAADRYAAAYRTYQSAIEQKLPFPEIKKHLDAYLVAKAAYAKGVNPAASQEQPIPASTNPTVVSRNQESPVALAAAEPAPASYPAEVRNAVTQLWQTKSQQTAERSMAELQSYIERHPGTSSANYAKYELAKAYETIKKDKTRAATLYSQLAADSRATIVGPLAKRRLTYLQAQNEQPKWKQYLSDKFQKMEDAYRSFSRTSWLAFPVKITRFVQYFSKLGSFKKAQSNESDFQLRLEELAAPYVGTVDQVYNEITVSGESRDDEGLVRLLNRNSESWFARWKIMSEARSSIDLQYFIISKDVFGMALLGLIYVKAREGVKIRFMTDARGSNQITHWFLGKDFLEELAEFPNVEIKVFNRIRQNLVTLVTDIRRVMASNHDKIIVVDGRYSIVGGRNIANEYMADKEDDPNAWRDSDIIIDSPEVAGELERAFTEEFDGKEAKIIRKDLVNASKKNGELEAAYQAMNTYLTTGNLYAGKPATSSVAKALKKLNDELKGYPGLKAYANYQPFEQAHQCPIKILDKHSLTGLRDDITGYIVRLIDASKKEIILQNPYVVLTPRAEAALKRAGKRGVGIIFHTNSPQTSDSFPTEAVMMAEWRNILRDIPTSRIYAQMGKGQLHAKTFVFDSKVGVVGTYNLDYVSEQINSEVVAAMHSDEFSDELRSDIMTDLASTRQYQLATADNPEYGPENVDGKNMWLIRSLAKIKWLRPLF
jgi:putative cardiolipin synthase